MAKNHFLKFDFGSWGGCLGILGASLYWKVVSEFWFRHPKCHFRSQFFYFLKNLKCLQEEGRIGKVESEMVIKWKFFMTDVISNVPHLKAQVVGGLHEEEVSTDPNSYQLPIFEPLKVQMTHWAKSVLNASFTGGTRYGEWFHRKRAAMAGGQRQQQKSWM